jgi:hypothetical protein
MLMYEALTWRTRVSLHSCRSVLFASLLLFGCGDDAGTLLPRDAGPAEAMTLSAVKLDGNLDRGEVGNGGQ